MMTKERYVELVQRLLNRIERQDEMYDALYKYSILLDPDPSGDTFEEIALCALEDAVDDKDGWTGYFLYERMGKLDEPCVWDKDHNPIDTSSWEKVYELIRGDENG